MDLYPWIVIAHVFLVIIAFGAHGVSAYVMFGVKREPDRSRVSALLELSSMALMTAGIALIVTVILGIIAAAMHGHFSRLWPWASIVVVVTVWIAMTPLAAGPMIVIRRLVGAPVRGKVEGEVGTDEELAAARARLRPELVGVIGLTGILILVWLMEVKPF